MITDITVFGHLLCQFIFSVIHIIVALECEAKPLIEHFQLYCDRRPGLFKRYIGKNKSISLTVSGVGKLNSAAAVTETYHYYPAQHGWLNVGIAGHATHQLGSGFLIGKLYCRSSQQHWYPQILFNPPLPTAELVSLDQASTNYTEMLYDMEAAGFYQIASRITLHEFIVCIKIVSDSNKNAIEKINKSAVSQWIAQRIPEIVYCIRALESLQAMLPSVDIEAQFNLLTNKAHFTRYQRHQLRSLLVRWDALLETQPAAILNQKEDAKKILEKIAHHLDQQPISYHEK